MINTDEEKGMKVIKQIRHGWHHWLRRAVHALTYEEWHLFRLNEQGGFEMDMLLGIYPDSLSQMLASNEDVQMIMDLASLNEDRVPTLGYGGGMNLRWCWQRKRFTPVPTQTHIGRATLEVRMDDD